MPSIRFWRPPAWIALSLLVLYGGSVAAQMPEKVGGSPATAEGSGVSGISRAGINPATGPLLLGDRGPDFKLKTKLGEEIHLKELRDNLAVVLVFIQSSDASPDSYDNLAQELKKQEIQLFIICRQNQEHEDAIAATHTLYDRWGIVARSYGALDPVNRDIRPTTVVLDRRGYIRYFSAGTIPEAGVLGETVTTVIEYWEKKTASSS